MQQNNHPFVLFPSPHIRDLSSLRKTHYLESAGCKSRLFFYAQRQNKQTSRTSNGGTTPVSQKNTASYTPSLYSSMTTRIIIRLLFWMSSAFTTAVGFTLHDPLGVARRRRRRQQRNQHPSSSPALPTSTILFYRNDTHDDDELYPNQHLDPTAVLTIPVLGPIPNQGPLLLGAEFTLNPPVTPLLWQTIQEAVWQHARFCQHHDDAHNQGTIDAAPLVAVMDTATSSSSTGRYGNRGRYATIAAVVGVTTTTTRERPTLDLSDSTTFMESLRQVGQQQRQTVAPWDSKIRLVGVGRALLRDFFYRMPSTVMQDHVDDEGYVQKMEKSRLATGVYQDNTEVPDDSSDDDIDEDRLNLVMAHFVVLTDRRRVDLTQPAWSRRDDDVTMSSPVHAVTEMASWARKLDYIHQDRRRLVAGLQAATARLESASARRQRSQHQGGNNLDWDDEFAEDYDGLGMLTASRHDMNMHEEREATQGAVEDVLQVPPVPHDEDDQGETPSQLTEMENYGMGYSSASFSTIPQVTTVWLEKLEPFYSPELRATEEYYYEILSFVAILSMDKFLRDRDMGWALTCANTSERMQQAYEWMYRHVRLLEQEAAEASAKLRDCGEECTDLW